MLFFSKAVVSVIVLCLCSVTHCLFRYMIWIHGRSRQCWVTVWMSVATSWVHMTFYGRLFLLYQLLKCHNAVFSHLQSLGHVADSCILCNMKSMLIRAMYLVKIWFCILTIMSTTYTHLIMKRTPWRNRYLNIRLSISRRIS